MIPVIQKLAPFLLRAHVLEVGRDRLEQVRNKLAFVLITEDLSENSREKMLADFRCPVYQCLTSAEIEMLFGYKGTKIVGFHRSPLSNNLLPELKPFRLTQERLFKMANPLPEHPTVAVLGASGIGKHHCNWWTLEGAQPVAFLGSSPESVAATTETLKALCGFSGKGYTNLEELLDKEQPDIVDVCLPPALHASAVRTALEHDRHVLCEKPFLFDEHIPFEQLLDDARSLSALARERHLLLGVCTQYVMAIQECLALRGVDKTATKLYKGTLVSPTRNRPPVPMWTWVDLAPHLLGVAQSLAPNGKPDWDSLKVDFEGHRAAASFLIPRHHEQPLHCEIITLHRDEAPQNVRQLSLDGEIFDIGGYKDADGVFQMKIESPYGIAERPDMLRLLIRSFLKGKLEMPAGMAIQNLEWLLQVIQKTRV